MEEQSKTITGQISNIEDAIDTMFNEIGQQSEGVINTTLAGITYIVEHYEKFGRMLLGLVATYGTYRTAIMLVTAAKGWATTAEALHYNWLLLVEKAQKMLNATMLNNPYVLVATLIAGVVTAMISMKTEAERLKEAEEDYEEQKRKTIEAEEEHKRRLEELCSVAGDEALSTETRRAALVELEQKYPDIFAKYDTEIEKLKHIKELKEEIAALEGQKSITLASNELKTVGDRIAELEQKKATEHSELRFGKLRRVGGLTKKEEAELQNLYNKKKTLSSQVEKDNANAYLTNLTGVGNATLEAEIKAREDLLAKLKINGNPDAKGRIAGGGASGTYSVQELQGQIQILRAEQNRRNAPKKSGSAWASEAKKKYEDALKEYNNFISSGVGKMSQDEFEAKAKALKDAVDAAKKDYDKVKPQKDSEAESAKREARRQQAEHERQLQAKERLGQQLADLQREADEMDLQAMQEGLAKKLRQIDNDYQQRKDKIDKQEAEFRVGNKKAGVSTGSDGLTEEQRSALSEARTKAKALYEKETADAQREAKEAQDQSMREYLKAYGTYQQQKLAIAEEYAEKIAKAESEGNQNEALRLRREQRAQEQQVEIASIKAEIDWEGIMGNLGAMLDDQLAPMLEKLRTYMNSEDFKQADLQDQQIVFNLASQIEQRLNGGLTKDMFSSLAQDIQAYQTSLKNLIEAKEKEKAASELLLKAKAAEAAIVKDPSATPEQKAAAAAATAQAQEAFDQAASAVQTFTEANQTAGQKLSIASNNAINSLKGFAEGLQGLKSGSLSGVGQGFGKLGDTLKNFGGSVGKAGEALSHVFGEGLLGELVNAILGIFDVLKDGIGTLISDIIDTVLGAVTGLIDNILSGDMFVQIGTSLVKGVGGLLDALTWGGFSSWLGSGDSDKHYDEDMERLTLSNESLEAAINNLSNIIEETAIANAKDAYEKQNQLLDEEIANKREQMDRSGSAYSNGFLGLGIGGSHSSNYKIDKGMTDDDWARMTQALRAAGYNSTVSSSSEFWQLSPEEMKAILDNAPVQFAKLKDLANDGYKDAAQYMDDYIAFAEQREELERAYQEKLTNTSFDSIRDEFKSAIMDMEHTAEDFANDFEKLMKDAVFESLMGSVFDDRLKAWYKSFADAMESGQMTPEEQEKLRREWDAMVKDATAQRDALYDTMGWESDTTGTSQSGKSGSFNAMSQDQGTKLEGLFTSGLIHWVSMDSQLEDVSGKMSLAMDHLSGIRENTGTSAEHLNEIKEDIKRIIRDGLKVK